MTKKENLRSSKDHAEKLLEDYNDVFADIINGLVYKGTRVVREEELEAGPTETLYKAAEGNLGEQRRDVLKRDKKNGTEYSVWFGLENQTGEDRTMPVRVMGYDYATYEQNLRRRKKGERIEPVVTLVLYFGNKRWRGPRRLHELVRLPEEIKEYVQDYGINLVEVSYLSEEEIGRFESDFRLVAEYFRARRLGAEEQMRYNTRTIRHVEAMLEFLRTFARYERFEKIQEELVESAKKGREIKMCNLVDQWVNMGEEKGKAEGRYISLQKIIKNGIPEAEGMHLLEFTEAEAAGYRSWLSLNYK